MNKYKNLHKCCMCGKIATWYKEKHEKNESLYYCDECVPRGHISNVDNIEDWDEPIEGALVMWWDEWCVAKDLLKDGSLKRNKDSFYYEYLDEFGRRNPSTNYKESKKGFEIYPKNKQEFVAFKDVYAIYNKQKGCLSKMEALHVSQDLAEILLEMESPCDTKGINYNLLMSKLGAKFKKHLLTIGVKNNLNKFYINFKRELSATKYIIEMAETKETKSNVNIASVV